LLHAFAQLRTKIHGIELTVIGPVDPSGPTAALIDELKLKSFTTIRSQLQTHEIAQAYADSDVAVVPSPYEEFGLPAGEAMACGIPVVATTGGALPEVVGDAGLTVPTADRSALAQAIERVLYEPELAAHMRVAGRARVLEHFTWNGAAHRLVDLYERASAAHPMAGSPTGPDGNRRRQPT
jgi:glycosyltransferase involved in cell wall biosynthesis